MYFLTGLQRNYFLFYLKKKILHNNHIKQHNFSKSTAYLCRLIYIFISTSLAEGWLSAGKNAILKFGSQF